MKSKLGKLTKPTMTSSARKSPNSQSHDDFSPFATKAAAAISIYFSKYIYMYDIYEFIHRMNAITEMVIPMNRC